MLLFYCLGLKVQFVIALLFYLLIASVWLLFVALAHSLIFMLRLPSTYSRYASEGITPGGLTGQQNQRRARTLISYPHVHTSEQQLSCGLEGESTKELKSDRAKKLKS